jgi:UDP-3-O-[3-hydroxymyristoyl] N-acetylglucosamine deacetylase
VGDLYVLGAPILGRFEGIYAGHALNNLLCRALLDQPRAWRLVSASTLQPALAQAG